MGTTMASVVEMKKLKAKTTTKQANLSTKTKHTNN